MLRRKMNHCEAEKAQRFRDRPCDRGRSRLDSAPRPDGCGTRSATALNRSASLKCVNVTFRRNGSRSGDLVPRMRSGSPDKCSERVSRMSPSRLRDGWLALRRPSLAVRLHGLDFGGDIFGQYQVIVITRLRRHRVELPPDDRQIALQRIDA